MSASTAAQSSSEQVQGPPSSDQSTEAADALSGLALADHDANLVDKMALPGIGLPLKQESPLPFEGQDGNWRDVALPLTVRERIMIAIMAVLKDKPDWERKVFDETIVARWKQESLAGNSVAQVQAEDATTEHDQDQQTESEDATQGVAPPARQKIVSEAMFQYCIEELHDQAADSQVNGFTEVMDANAAVYISDKAVSHDTKIALQLGVAKLEAVPDNQKDWHPGSDGKVLDVVHPSLFPLMYGTSRFLDENKVALETCSAYCALGETVPIQANEGENLYAYSLKHQWLPCDVSVDSAGGAAITSYINNLHPDSNKDLYAAIEKVISNAIPMWKMAVRSTLYRQERPRVTVLGDGYDHDAAAKRTEEQRETADTNDGDSDDLYVDPYTDEFVVVPEPETYVHRERKSTEENASTFNKTFSGDKLQIIVKLANIHLTPEAPAYDGGSWHIEGLPNEHICASALYYYDSSNVTESHLAFRENVNEEFLTPYSETEFNFPEGPFAEQHKPYSITEIYGLDDADDADYMALPANQIVGQVSTREDRLLVFPNVLQHRVSPFALQDPTKPGHRKLLALFLVDPNITIPSTVNIPPQQLNWWAKHIDQIGALEKLPQELRDRVYGEVHGFPLTMERAKAVREELMEERKAQLAEMEEGWSERSFSFCEH